MAVGFFDGDKRDIIMKKQPLHKRLLARLDVRKWRTRSKVILCIVLVLLIAVGVLYYLMPTKNAFMNHAALNAPEELREQMAKDVGAKRPKVIVAYNDLGIISQCSFEIKGAQPIVERYVGFAGHVFDANEGVGMTVGRLVNFTYRMLGIGQGPLFGIKLTLLLTFMSVLSGFIIAVFLALGKISKNKLISKICSGYIFFFRGTPLLIQLMFLYFGLPTMLNGMGVEFAWTKLGALFMESPNDVYMGSFIASYISFTLNSAAYCAEIVRAAILSIDKGQHEAAKALGMTYGQTMSKVIIPQSIGRLIPPFANEFVLILKDASLVFAVSLQDVTTISSILHNDYASSLPYVPALAIYLVLTWVLTAIFNKLEKKFSHYL